uniref:Uncharacterized protein n=1 Tax=Setaria italica TaxID=4555 RepID=K3YMQ5_SETIT
MFDILPQQPISTKIPIACSTHPPRHRKTKSTILNEYGAMTGESRYYEKAASDLHVLHVKSKMFAASGAA